MGLRRSPDGTIHADTAAELAEYDRMLAEQARPVKPGQLALLDEPGRRRRGGRAPKEPSASKSVGKGNGKWTAANMRSFLSKTTKRTREVIDAALKVGHGASSKALAQQLGSSPYGIGKRVEKAKIDARAYNQDLPPPVSLVGDAGHKDLAIDPSFLAASQEVGGR
jgi:hypothetical protein